MGSGWGEEGFPSSQSPSFWPEGLFPCQLLLPSEVPPKLEILWKFCLSLLRELTPEDRAQSEQLAADAPEMSGDRASEND